MHNEKHVKNFNYMGYTQASVWSAPT
jgi:hypothetical protein